MKKILTLLAVCLTVLSSVLPVSATDGRVTYNGRAGSFVFAPGSDESLTDLFPNFKGVMPGDILTQRITVKNDVSNNVKVKIYLRSLGAHADSVEFLSQLALKVKTSEDNSMAYMFNAAASETAQLTDWVCLGTLYAGGEVNLDVILDVPVELDNEFQNKIGYLDWEFMIEEFPIEPTDPVPPTGDDANLVLWFAVTAAALGMILLLLVWRKKDKENEETAVKR